MTAFGVSKPRQRAVCHVKPVRKQDFCFQNMFCMACVTRFLIRVNAERFRKKALPPYELGGSGACPKPHGLKAIAIVSLRFSNSQLTRGLSSGEILICQGSKMLLGGFVVLFLGLAFFLSVLPQSLCASPAIMPTTACVVFASQEKIISTIPSEKSRASALPRTLAPAPSLFSTRKIASPSLGLSGYVGIGTTSPAKTLEVNGTAKIDTGLIASLHYPAADGTTAIQFDKSDGTTNVMDIDTTSGRVGIGLTNPGTTLQVYNNAATQLTVSGYGGSTADNASGKIAIGADTSYQGILQYSDNGSSYFYIDNNYDNAAATTMFRMRTNGTPVNAITILGSGNVGMGFTSPFFASPIASITEATQPTFPNLSWQAKRNQNPAHGMALTAAARDFDDHSRASPRRQAA